MYTLTFHDGRWRIERNNYVDIVKTRHQYLIRSCDKKLFNDVEGMTLLPHIKLFDDGYLETDYSSRIPTVHDTIVSLLSDRSRRGYHLPPRTLLLYEGGKKYVFINRLQDYNEDYITDIGKLSDMLIEALSSYIKLVAEREELYLSFSGGIDSTLLLYILGRLTDRIKAVTIALEGAQDEAVSKDVLKKTGLDVEHIVVSPTEDDLIKAIYDIKSLIPNIDGTLLSIAVSEYLTYNEVPKGRRIVMGQGADELFGGYDKYRRTFPSFKTENIIDLSLLQYTTGYIEWLLASKQNIYVEYPYLSPSVIEVAAKTPQQYKVMNPNDFHRKWIIRTSLKMLNAPKDVYMRRKKAMQYSTGISKRLKRIVR